MDGEIPPRNHMECLEQSGAGTGDVHGLKRLRTETPGHLGRRRRLERIARNAAVDQQIDRIGCDAVLLQTSDRRTRGEFTGRQRHILLEIPHLAVAPVEKHI